jgi:C4-dicarboxylate-specific signal transduction histidine kinase
LSTQRRQAREQLRQHRANLEKLVEERAAAQKQRVEEARRHQEELLHAARLSTLGEMAWGIVHELNQPLAAIGNYSNACLGLLQSEVPDVPRITRNLQQVVSQSERAGAIIRKMRALVQKKELQLAPVNLNEAIRSILLLVRSEMADQAVQLKLQLTEPLPPVLADAVQMEQVVLNLTRNALEALDGVEEPSRLLTIRTKVIEGDRVQMEVCDTGVGLPAGEPHRIFEPFFTTKANGLGLGLSISRSIVHMHQGSLAATRNPERGSTFSVTLPAEPLTGSFQDSAGGYRKTEGNGPFQPILKGREVIEHYITRLQGVRRDVTRRTYGVRR